ncbi:TadE/TadG family type IV pilus assembly protein [Oricola indica]|jgi:Flp pilus assembly protein TadG|uniref:TadE/TadG family type IV pilus assembly protein n=1 Tax=Oricola indica TaxID=2872591 RepID=UPI001CC07276|nr:TadE/TadG family type IV pilus assembly protein [Oricola indica]
MMTKTRSLIAKFRRFTANRRGAAAIEFALVVPMMLVMYLGTLEISGAVSINKKVSRIAATVADLVTQQTETNKTDLKGMLEIGESLLFPYTAEKPRITITAINVNSSYPTGGKVAWARRYNKGTFDDAGLNKNQNTWVPDDLRIDGTFLVRVDAELDYVPIVHWLIGDTTGKLKDGVGVIEMSERYFLRPRLGASIPCTNC